MSAPSRSRRSSTTSACWPPRAATGARCPSSPTSSSPAARCSRRRATARRSSAWTRCRSPTTRATAFGGHRTLRGYRQDRFVGSVMTAANLELRWTFAHLELKGQRFGFIAVPFVDAGRPYDNLGQLSLRDWRLSYGGALRIPWNLATVVTVDYGVSSEDAGRQVP